MPSYSTTAIVLHWVLAIALASCFLLGLYMTGLSFSPQRIRLYSWHKWLGSVILGVTVLRLLWRLMHRPPPHEGMAPLQRRMASAGHGLLYLLSLAVPLVGWTYSSAAGFPVVVFGMLPLPDLVAADKALAAAIKPWHQTLAWTMAVLVLGHIGAVVKHQLIDRDGLLARMSLFQSRKA